MSLSDSEPTGTELARRARSTRPFLIAVAMVAVSTVVSAAMISLVRRLRSHRRDG
jgi:hypothetical protein